VKRWLCLLGPGLLVATLWACRPTPEPGGARARVRVAAASDLNAALADLMARFRASHDVDITVSYGSSGTFYAQLLNRAPFDMFLSADLAYPRQLADRDLIVPESAFEYGTGRLVVWVPASSALDLGRAGLQALTAASVAHVAIANPEHAPYGRAAVAAMRTQGVYERVQPKLVFGESVAQAMQFVQSGAADAGIVALSLALAPAVKANGRWVEIATSDYPAIEQGGVILRWAADIDAAKAFRAYLVSADGRAILEQYGFFPPGT